MHVSSILIHVRQGNSHKIPVAKDQSEAKITTISQSNKKDIFCCWEILELHSRKMHYTIAKIAHLSSTCPLLYYHSLQTLWETSPLCIRCTFSKQILDSSLYPAIVSSILELIQLPLKANYQRFVLFIFVCFCFCTMALFGLAMLQVKQLFVPFKGRSVW